MIKQASHTLVEAATAKQAEHITKDNAITPKKSRHEATSQRKAKLEPKARQGLSLSQVEPSLAMLTTLL